MPRIWRSTCGARVAAIAFLLATLAGGPGCDRRGEPSSRDEGPDATDRTDGTGRVSEAPDAGDNRRSAFGLPFPPKVGTVVRRNSGVKVTTRMELDQIEQFFKTRLKDFEILRPAHNKIRIVGLYEFMPAVRGHQFGPVSVLFYRDVREDPAKSSMQAEKADDDAGAPNRPARDRSRERETGAPVRLETDDGELLAPGAKWGHPYTPPPGSPLHKPRYRANFGKPIGEWQLP